METKRRRGNPWTKEQAEAARATAASVPRCAAARCNRKVGKQGDRERVLCYVHKGGAAPPPEAPPAPTETTTKARVVAGSKPKPKVKPKPKPEAKVEPPAETGGTMRAKAAGVLGRALRTSISGRSIDD